MKINAVYLSGFKNFEKNVKFEFYNHTDNQHLNMVGERKESLFEAMLGILFGFDESEKKSFKNNLSTEIFSGLLVLKFDKRLFHIERDINNDSVSFVIKNEQDVKIIFQGKDIPSETSERPYLKVLSSLFPITDKHSIKNICYEFDSGDDSRLINLLEAFNLLLSPWLKFAGTKKLLLDSYELIRSIPKTDNKDSLLVKKFLKIMSFKGRLTQLIKLDTTLNEITDDIKKFRFMYESFDSHLSVSGRAAEILKQNYPLLIQFDAVNLKESVLSWKELQKEKQVLENELHKLRQKKAVINRNIDDKLLLYRNLPPTFKADIDEFKELNIQLELKKKRVSGMKVEMIILKAALKERYRRKWYLIVVIPAIFFFIFYYLVKQMWIFIIPETIIIAGIIIFYIGHLKTKIKKQIKWVNEEAQRLEKDIHDTESKLIKLKQKSLLFENPEYLDTHIERYRKYRQMLDQLNSLEIQENKILEMLQDEMYLNQIPAYQKKYSTYIDITRPDLEKYLEDFIDLQNKQAHSATPEIPLKVKQEIRIIIRSYLKLRADLLKMRTTYLKSLHMIYDPDKWPKLITRVDEIIENLENRLSPEK
ncbi:MAG: hypothetical protein AB7W47_14115 [Calditrichaceae bacterium]